MLFTAYAVVGVSIGIIVSIAVLVFGGGLWAMFVGYVAGGVGGASFSSQLGFISKHLKQKK